MSLANQHVSEVVFPAAAALLVLDSLAESGAVVLGGDFWRRTETGEFQPTYENWYTEREAAELIENFAARSVDRARREIEQRHQNEDFVTLTCQLK